MAALALPHARQHGLDHVDDAEVVGVEHRPDLGVLALLDRGHVAVARVVHQDVDGAQALPGLGHRGGDLVADRHVEGHRHGALGVPRDDVFDGRRVARRHDDAVAPVQRRERDLAPDARGAAGDEPGGGRSNAHRSRDAQASGRRRA